MAPKQADLFGMAPSTVVLSTPVAEPLPRFDGDDYVHPRDHARLSGQMLAIYDLIKGGAWFTLREIATATGAPEASVSAHLRSFRKDRFGAHTVDRRHRGDPAGGLYEYRFVENTGEGL